MARFVQRLDFEAEDLKKLTEKPGSKRRSYEELSIEPLQGAILSFIVLMGIALNLIVVGAGMAL
ncbi:MAG: hypothetical protein ACPGJV_06415 [Bacteriovoracaceae bacterium]